MIYLIKVPLQMLKKIKQRSDNSGRQRLVDASKSLLQRKFYDKKSTGMFTNFSRGETFLDIRPQIFSPSSQNICMSD